VGPSTDPWGTPILLGAQLSMSHIDSGLQLQFHLPSVICEMFRLVTHSAHSESHLVLLSL